MLAKFGIPIEGRSDNGFIGKPSKWFVSEGRIKPSTSSPHHLERNSLADVGEGERQRSGFVNL